MSTRRPRIKAAANLALASKRKPKGSTETKPEKTKVDFTDSEEKSIEVKVENTVSDITAEKTTTNGNLLKSQESLVEIKLQATTLSETFHSATPNESAQPTIFLETPESTNHNDPIPRTLSPSALETLNPTEPNKINPTPKILDTVIPNEPIPLPSPLNSPEIIQNSSGKTLQSFEDAFKYPFNPNYKRHSAVVASVEENTASDFEDNILHIDLQKSPGFPMSPTKSRQRIRPTPIFGQRRNSFVGTSPSPHTEDEPTGTTRQRSSNSTSSDVSGSFLMRKLAAGNLGRIRTESGCSTISESRGSTRKIPNDEQSKSYRKELHMRLNGGTPDKSTLKMFDLIYYNPTTNPMEKRPTGSNQAGDKSSEVVIEAESKIATATESAMPVPQLKLGSNGELMIDEMSLEIETTAEVEARKVLANTGLIYHDENTSGEGFYKRTKRTKDWQPEETIKFYRCLQTVGTDFSLMLTLFPNRTRRDLKLKFKKEERCNLNLINKALLFPGTFNIEDLKDQLDAEDKERQEQERLWKEIKAKEAKHAKKTLNVVSKTSRILTPGDEIYQNENITKAKLSKRSAGKNKSQNSEPKEKRRRKSKKAAAAEAVDPKTETDHEVDDILDITSEVDTIDSLTDNDGLNEASINLILNELANGTLALVSSEDLTCPNKTTFHEIYIMCKETKQLSDKPLDLPEDIVNAILTAMTS